MASFKKLLREEAGVRLFEVGEPSPSDGPVAATIVYRP